MANRDIIRHFTMTFSSVISIGVALMISMIMTVAALNISHFTENIQSEFIIHVSIRPGTTQEDKDLLEEKLSRMRDVSKVTYSSKENELDLLIKENGDVFAQYQGEDKNPLYDIFVVELTDNKKIQDVSDVIKKYDNVAKVSYGGSMIVNMINLMEMVRKWGYIFVIAMGVLAVFLIRNTIKMAIQVRKDEIAIMRQVGAMNWYVTFPFMLEGMITGILGALGPILVCIGGYTYLYKSMNGMFLSEMFKLIPPFPFTLQISLGMLIIGLIVGMVGSLLAARKYLRWSR
ncbi:MAG: ABC transporter permease [Holdemanella sp.]|nr:ABC transporter permease [Holdemanella sp.]